MDTPSHFTYAEFEPGDDLNQGDILQPTERLSDVLRDVHSHFCDERYCAFLVLTQTCDLVRRGQQCECKSRYINLAVVRPLEDVLVRLLDNACKRVEIGGKEIRGLYGSKTKAKAHELLQRILNQNAQALGVFYLHNDGAVQLADPSVAMLQVSIAMRAAEHYDTLVEARTGRLKAEFQSRLGWLIGNLFSRVATQDMPPEQRKEIIERVLKRRGPLGEVPQWVSEDKVDEANRKALDPERMDSGELLETLGQLKPKKPREIAIERAVEATRAVVDGFSPEQSEQITAWLQNDERFRKVCR